jgi:hypothetical protein
MRAARARGSGGGVRAQRAARRTLAHTATGLASTMVQTGFCSTMTTFLVVLAAAV